MQWECLRRSPSAQGADMLEQEAGPAETKGFWAQAAADGGVTAGAPREAVN